MISPPPRLFRKGQRLLMRDPYLDRFAADHPDGVEYDADKLAWVKVLVVRSLQHHETSTNSWWSMTVREVGRSRHNYTIGLDTATGEPRGGSIRRPAVALRKEHA